jgi:TolB-like protein
MHKSIVLCGGLLIFTACGTQRETFAQGLHRIASTFARAGQGKTIAVLEFPNLEDQTSNLSRLVSERLTTELVRTLMPRGRVVERRQVIQVLTERGLAQANLTSDQVRQIGQLLGADAVVLGTHTIVGRNLVVNARLVTVPAGNVAAADLLDIAAPPELLALAQTGLPARRLTPMSPDPLQTRTPETDTSAILDIESPDSASTRVPARQPLTRNLGDLTFRLSQCRGRGTSILCAFTVTAITADATFRPGCGGTSRLYDESGQETLASHMYLANQYIDSRSEATLVAGVTTPGEYTFRDTREDARNISLLKLHFCSLSNQFELEFRDIPIQR